MTFDADYKSELFTRLPEEKTFTNFLKNITKKQLGTLFLLLIVIGGVSYLIGLGIGAYEYQMTHYNEMYFTMHYSWTTGERIFTDIRTGKTYPRDVLINESLSYSQEIAVFNALFSMTLVFLLVFYFAYISYKFKEQFHGYSYYYMLSFKEKSEVLQTLYNQKVVIFKHELQLYYPPPSNPNEINLNTIIQLYHDLKLPSKPLWERYAFAEAVDRLYPLNPRFIDHITEGDQKLTPYKEYPKSALEKAKKITPEFTDITYKPANLKPYLLANFFFLTQNISILLWLLLFMIFYFQSQPASYTNVFNDVLRDVSFSIFTLDILGALGFLYLGYLFYTQTLSDKIKRDTLIMQGVVVTWFLTTMAFRITSGLFPALFNPNITGTKILVLMIEAPLHGYSGYFYVLSSYVFILFIFTLKRLFYTMRLYNEVSPSKIHAPWNSYMVSLFLGITILVWTTILEGLNGSPKTRNQDSLFIFLGRILKLIIAPLFASKLFLDLIQEFLSKKSLSKKNHNV